LVGLFALFLLLLNQALKDPCMIAFPAEVQQMGEVRSSKSNGQPPPEKGAKKLMDA
jgi:hypothetical protein